MSKIVQLKDQEGVSLYPKVLEEYSSTEKVVGRWDNKPIYRKVYTFTTSNDSNIYINHGLQNLEKYWVNMGKSFILNNSETLSPNFYYGTNDWARIWLNTTQIRFRSPSSLGSRTVYLTVEYTKTTD